MSAPDRPTREQAQALVTAGLAGAMADLAELAGLSRECDEPDLIVERIRAALTARTPQPAEPSAERWGRPWGSGGHGNQREDPAPLPAVPDGSGEHVAAEANGVLWMAMRYALGRATYAVQEVGAAIAQHAHLLAPWQRERMAQEIERELGYDSDGAAWGSDAATWRQAINDLRAPVPAVPDGEDALEPDAADPDDVRQALRAALRGRDKAADEVEQLRDQLDRAHALNRKQHRELVELTMVPPPPFGEDVPACLDAAADVIDAHNPYSCAGGNLRSIATSLRLSSPEMCAAVAAALARPTEPQG